MKKLAVIAVLVSSVSSAQAHTSAFGDGTELPAVSACQMAPLTPQQLTADEKAIFDKLPVGSGEATKFLFTRGYLRFAKLVIAGSIQPTDLPCLPASENWNSAHLTPEEAKDILDVALGRKIVARMRKDVQPPPSLVLLTPQQLDPAERVTFAELPMDSDAARRFLHTRSFLRPCKEVVERKRDPTQLPNLPGEEYWDRQYLSESESKDMVDVCLGMKILAVMNTQL